MKILIVGSGPSSYGSLLKLINIPNLEITIVDNASELGEFFDDCIFIITRIYFKFI